MSLQRWEFDFLRALVREHSGIVLEAGKEYLVESRMAALIAERPDVETVADIVTILR